MLSAFATVIWMSLGLLALALAMAAFLATGLVQYGWLFLAKRWRRRVRPPSPSAYLRETLVGSAGAHAFVHCREAFRLQVRHAFDEAAPVWRSDVFAARIQSSVFRMWSGCAWEKAIPIPVDGLADGPHILEVLSETGRSFRAPLLIRRSFREIAVVCSTNTWAAYNSYGGLSNYHRSAVPPPLTWFLKLCSAMNLRVRLTDRTVAPETPLALARPLENLDTDIAGQGHKPGVEISHLYRAETALMQALGKAGFEYCVATDADFARASLTHAKLVIFAGHSEYWSEAGVGVLAERVARGASTAFFSGNNIYRLVEARKDALVITRQTIDPNATAGLIGAGYDSLGYLDFAPYRVVEPDHWLFEGLGLSRGDTFGPRASGFETDKRRGASPPDAILVAMGENVEGPAHFVCRDFRSGGFLVNAGSVAIASACGKDPVIDGMLKNMAVRAGIAPVRGASGEGG